MPPIAPTMPSITKNQILEALICAAFGLHAGGKTVLEFARGLFGHVAVSHAEADRQEEEKQAGMNGGWGEEGAHAALARAYFHLVAQGDGENAEELRRIALGRFLKEDFENQVRKIGDGR